MPSRNFMIQAMWQGLLLSGILLSPRASAQPAQEQDAEQTRLAPYVQKLNAACNSNLRAVIDWPAFRAGYSLMRDDSGEPGSKERTTANKCRFVMDAVRGGKRR